MLVEAWSISHLSSVNVVQIPRTLTAVFFAYRERQRYYDPLTCYEVAEILLKAAERLEAYEASTNIRSKHMVFLQDSLDHARNKHFEFMMTAWKTVATSPEDNKAQKLCR